MKPIERKSERLGERYFYQKHPSGLNIYVYPKQNYNSAYALFGTKFGSINNTFKIKGQDKTTKIPDGMAHFLEHKLFEGKDEDAFKKFARTGASANAFTSFDKTAYLFSCSDNFNESLKILLDFVQNPCFTDENVKKEQGIIGQEIKMYEDSPEWRVFFNLVKAMYQKHSVNVDIAGTVESIAQITPEILYDCYNNYYNLNNMCLSVVGDVDAERVFAIVESAVSSKKCNPIEVENIFESEPKEVSEAKTTQNLAVTLPLFNLGFKETIAKERVNAEDEIYTEIILSAISSKSSPLYKDLLDRGIINSSFGCQYFHGPWFASVIFSGESKQPDLVAEIIKKEILKARTNGIDNQTFERAKKMLYASYISMFNNNSTIAKFLLEDCFRETELFNYIEIFSNLSLDKVNKRLSEIMNESYSSLSVINPHE